MATEGAGKSDDKKRQLSRGKKDTIELPPTKKVRKSFPYLKKRRKRKTKSMNLCREEMKHCMLKLGSDNRVETYVTSKHESNDETKAWTEPYNESKFDVEYLQSQVETPKRGRGRPPKTAPISEVKVHNEVGDEIKSTVIDLQNHDESPKNLSREEMKHYMLNLGLVNKNEASVTNAPKVAKLSGDNEIDDSEVKIEPTKEAAVIDLQNHDETPKRGRGRPRKDAPIFEAKVIEESKQSSMSSDVKFLQNLVVSLESKNWELTKTNTDLQSRLQIVPFLQEENYRLNQTIAKLSKELNTENKRNVSEVSNVLQVTNDGNISGNLDGNVDLENSSCGYGQVPVIEKIESSIQENINDESIENIEAFIQGSFKESPEKVKENSKQFIHGILDSVLDQVFFVENQNQNLETSKVFEDVDNISMNSDTLELVLENSGDTGQISASCSEDNTEIIEQVTDHLLEISGELEHNEEFSDQEEEQKSFNECFGEETHKNVIEVTSENSRSGDLNFF